MEVARQFIHLSGIVFIIAAKFIGKELILPLFLLISLFFAFYSFYVSRKEVRNANFFEKIEMKFRKFVFRFERKNSKIPFAGVIFFYLGCSLALIIFPLSIALAACAMLTVGDAFSTLIGIRYGKTKIGSKSLEGVLACFLTSFFVGSFFIQPQLSFIGAIFASLAELIPKIDDNITIPLVSGFAMFLFSFFI
jgi:dolichol kinase